MAVLSTETIWFMGENFKRVIRVLKDGKFRIKYPEIIKEVTDKREAAGDTLEEAIHEFKQTIKDFEAASTTSRKVIVYKLQNQISFSVGAALSIAAGVYVESKYEIPSTGELFYNYKSVDREYDLPYNILSNGLTSGFGEEISEDRCIDWTPARHAFFEMMAEAMSTLKTKISELSNDREKVLAMADLGQKLLP